MAQTGKKEGVLHYLLFLTAFFILLEISFFIRCNQAYLFDFTFISNKLQIPLSILPGIIFFIFAQLLTHLVFCLIVWLMANAISNLFSLSKNKKLFLAISVWLLGISTILVANCYYYPNSKFADFVATILFNRTVTRTSLIILSSLCASCILLTSWYVFLFLNHISRVMIVMSVMIFLIYVNTKTNSYIHDAATTEKPNIILIGMDSLRPDFLSFFGHDQSTPFLDSLLTQATVFSEAVTPLARTFPSWTSILTGEYPREIGIRFNLANQNGINFSPSLADILHHHGYETVFATDETRFSNIEKNYGFDKVITPPVGLNDFLLGTFNDFPLSNLLINTAIGKYLFPYSYANRPIYFTYEPNSFLHLVTPALSQSRSKPLFLAIHFCLPHYPYLWADSDANNENIVERYQASIVRVDQQLNDFFAILQKNHLLDHAIVVLLSDHGEALELPGDRITERDLFFTSRKKNTFIPRFYPPSLDNENINQSAGHGTDVLGLPQYHTLLAFKFYGLGTQRKEIIPGVVSLLDIKPTVLQLIHLPIFSSNGESLANVIQSQGQVLIHKEVFLESDYSPEAIHTVYPETRKILLEGIQLFQIDPATLRLTVKKTMGEMIINSKQFAEIDGNWMLALYPQNNHYRLPILINLATGEWTDDLHNTFAQHSPAKKMLQGLHTFYGKDIK